MSLFKLQLDGKRVEAAVPASCALEVYPAQSGIGESETVESVARVDSFLAHMSEQALQGHAIFASKTLHGKAVPTILRVVPVLLHCGRIRHQRHPGHRHQMGLVGGCLL